jgi:Mor family transcriptional regulator
MATYEISRVMRISESMVANVIARANDAPHLRKAEISKSSEIYAGFIAGMSFYTLAKTYNITVKKVAYAIGIVCDWEAGK